jgi:hypothetical protein
MKRGRRYAFGAATAAALLVSVGLAAGQPTPEQPGNVTRFSGAMSVPMAGAAAPMMVEIKDWLLVGNEKAFQIPAQGFYVVQLRSSTVVTDIAGKSEKHQAGDFWTVAAGEPMTVTLAPHAEAAQLQTIAVTPTR